MISAAHIIARLDELGMSRPELARRAGLTQPAVHAALSGAPCPLVMTRIETVLLKQASGIVELPALETHPQQLN